MIVRRCPVCSGEHVDYSFAVEGRVLFQCAECNVLCRDEVLMPAGGPLTLTALGFLRDVYVPRALTPEEKVQRVVDAGGADPGTRLLAFRCEDAAFLELLADRGVNVSSVESVPTRTGRVHAVAPTDLAGPREAFDTCVIFDSLALNADPAACLRTAWQALRPDGLLVLSTPSLGGWPAHLFRRAWVEFHKPYLYYFDTANVQNLLFQAGFDRVEVHPHTRTTTPEFLIDYLREFPSRRVRSIRRLARLVALGPVKRMPLTVPGGHVVFSARKAAPRTSRTFSVIVPVYNERATFGELMNRLLAKEVAGLEREVVVVESRSTDGTREEVEKFRGAPGVKILFEDRPRGKGHAVREGLRHATGEFIVIQDADLEYDLDDYDALLTPLVHGSHAFVIGSRHVQGQNVWKMRQFNDMPFRTWLYNAGHVFFLGLFNTLYRQSLTDPFSMFKVFRRDCLHQVEFECDRFDFDFELVIKLLRKGYRPIEIPVNYRSRSFAEGKKVRTFRDPLTWLKALVKYRFSALGSR
jgi:SAM-dependent methyltransferase